MTLIKSGTILFLASMAGNISNYLFQFFMSRHLSLEDYGAMNAVFSILTIVAIPTGTIMLVVAKYIATFKAKGEEDKVSSLYQNSLIKMAGLGIAGFVPFFVFHYQLAGYLKIDSGWPLIITGVGLFFTFVATVNFGMLQGLQRFYYLGAGMGLGGFLRLICGIVLIVIGFGLNGAVAAPVLATFLVFAITFIPLSAYSKKKPIKEKHTKDILLYSIPVLLSTVAFTTLTNIDMIIVKHIFSPEEAGIYAAVSILGKTILYLPAAFVLALFPMVSESHALSQNVFKILDKALAYTIAISLAGVLGFFFFPEMAVRTLFGGKFAGAAPLLKFYGLAMMFMAIIGVLISFNLARHKTSFIYTLGFGCIVLLAGISIFHNSLSTVIFIIMSVNICLAAVNLWMVYQDRRAFYRIESINMEGVGSR